MAQNTVAAQTKQKPKKQKNSQFSGMSKALVRRETISAYCFLLPSLIFFVGSRRPVLSSGPRLTARSLITTYMESFSDTISTPLQQALPSSDACAKL